MRHVSIKSKLLIAVLLLLVMCSSAAAAEMTNDTVEAGDDCMDLKITEEDDLTASATFNDLSEEIKNTNPGSVLTLNKDYNNITKKVIIDKDITIDGKGHTLDGKNNNGLAALYIQSGHVRLENLIFINSKNTNEQVGGAIYIYGTGECSIVNCTFKENSAFTYGGGIFNGVRENTLTVTDSKFIKNTAENNAGGAIYSRGKLTIENSVFENNTALVDAGAVYGENFIDVFKSTFIANTARGHALFTCLGGAICAKGDIYIEKSNFTQNSADSNGGAVYSYNDMLVKESVFEKNTAKEGGAVFGSGSYVIVEKSIFKQNRATSSHGGAVSSNKWAHIGNSTFILNTAEKRGGAIYTTYIQFSGKTSFLNNSAKSHGGAVYTNTIARENSNLYFEGNHADSDFGGALYINNKCEDVFIRNSVFANNYAIKGDGGAIYSDSGSTKLHIIGCNFTANSATDGIEKRYGGAIRSKDTLYVENSIFTNNRAENYGGAIYANLVDSIKNSSFISNHAKEGGAIYVNNKCTMTVTTSYFRSNNCDERGGAIYTDSKDTALTLTNNAFISNTAGGDGQDVFNSGKYNAISNNWWGKNNPSFSNKLKEYHTFGSNEDHSDSSPLKVSLSGEATGYADFNVNLKVTFSGTVSPYVFNYIDSTSDKNGSFESRKIGAGSMEFYFIPDDGGTHEITVKLDSETLKYNVLVTKTSVYGKDLTKVNGDDKVFSAVFRNSSGQYLPQGSRVSFQLEGNIYYATVMDDGLAIVNEVINLAPGQYTIKSINNYTGEFFTNHITVLARNMTYKINDTFVMRFVDDDNIRQNSTIVFEIGSKQFKSNITNGIAFFKLNVSPGKYTVNVKYNNRTIDSVNITVVNAYSKSVVHLNGSNYGSLIPIYTNETFVKKGDILYSTIGENTYRYITKENVGVIVYNVTASNNEELTKVLRKISDTNFKADVIIINLKNTVYTISESFYKDQEWSYLIHLTHGKLFINGNGATIDDGYHHNFMTVESGTTATVENLNFKKFYRVFVNNGELYCKNSQFIENDAAFWATETPGSVVYNKNTATFENCIFDHNDNKHGASIYFYQSKLMAGVLYAEEGSLTNFVKCNFKTEYDTIHACDGSMVILYDENANNYNFLTKRPNNNFEIGSCLDYRPASTFNMNKTLSLKYTTFSAFLSDFAQELYKREASAFEINLTKGDYTVKMSDFNNPDFRTYYNSEVTIFAQSDKNENTWIHHRYLLDVGSRAVVINGNGAKLTLTDTSDSKDNHFAFIPKYGTLTLINLTLSGFNSAITNYGKLIVINCTFEKNIVHYLYQKNEGEYGGAVRNYASAFFYNTTFKDNRATKGAAYYSKGSSALGQFSNCVFTGNTIISNLAWKTGDANNMFLDDKSIVKLINSRGIDKSNIETDHEGMVMYRNSIQESVLNYTVSDYASLMKLSKLIKDNDKYDIINVTFLNGNYGLFADSKILFEMDYGVLILNGNNSRIFVQTPKDNDDTQFLRTTSRSSVVINKLTIEGFNIALENNGGLTIFDSNFNYNKADYNHKKDYGGAIVNSGDLTIFDSTFTGNYAKYGGAIYNTGNAHVILSNFTDNTGYNSNSKVDIYNHKASVEVVNLGGKVNVVEHFPVAAWRQDLAEAIITAGITLISGGASFGISSAGIAAAHFINLAVGAGVGAAGGLLNALTYSHDNQDYSQFSDRLFSGISDGLGAVIFGEVLYEYLSNGFITPIMAKSPAEIENLAFETLVDELLNRNLEITNQWVSAAVNGGEYDEIFWYSFFKEW